MKILSVFGTRPEAIKMAPLVRALSVEPEIEQVVCVTGQHHAMLDQVLSLFEIHPDMNLAVMAPDQALNGLAARVFERIDPVLVGVAPDRVLVHGDTTTAMATTVAAFHRRIPVGHVEAGLRTYDLSQPWPEEMNRRVIDVMADLLFAPTATAKANLAAERVAGRIVVTGNTVVDALAATVARIDRDATLRARLARRFARIPATKKVLLVTAHRREKFGAGLERLCNAILALSARPDIEIVFPVHLNPNIREVVHARLGGQPTIHLMDPFDYGHFVYIMNRAAVILTDSGGVQEEATALGKPVLVTRDATERPEAIAAGVARLVGTDPEQIVTATAALLAGDAGTQRSAPRVNPFGDGHASRRIVDTILGRSVAEFGVAAKPGRAKARAAAAG